jgi:hypothetical protein
MLRELTAPLLLTATALGLVVAVRARARTDEIAPWRAALVKSAVLLGVFVVLSVEGLSALGMLRAAPLAVAWSMLLLIAWTAASASFTRGAGAAAPQASAQRRQDARLAGRCGERLEPDVVALVAACVAFAALTLVVAVLAPPNNWDSMTYHMPRVAHWLANGSVRHYPIGYPVQLFMPPFSGYAIATIQSLAASDRWANTVQWAAYVEAAVAVSLVAARIGAGRRVQALAALALLTIPMAVSEASTTQVDMVAAAWLVTLFVFALDRPSRSNVLWAAATLGLGVSTKAHMPFYSAPVFVLLLRRWGRDGVPLELRHAVGAVAVVAAVALLLVAPHAMRNAHTFGKPWGAGFEVDRQRVTTPTLATLVSNVLRDSVLHLPLPGYGRAVERLHDVVGIDPNDERTTHIYDLNFSDVAAKWFRPLTPNEDFVGNPMHLALALAFAVVALVRRRHWDDTVRAAMVIGATATAGWLLLQVPTKWQPWSSRYDLPFFAVLAVPLGIGLDHLSPRTRAVVTVALVGGALPALLLDVHRPLVDIQAVASWPWWVWGAIAVVLVVGGAWPAAAVAGRAARNAQALRVAGRFRVRAIVASLAVAALGPVAARFGAQAFARQSAFPPLSIVTADRTHVMFRGNPLLESAYVRAVHRVHASRCDVVGLEFRRDAWEYPLWSLLGAASGGGPRLRAVAVANESATLAPEAPEPCVVVSSATTSAFDGRAGWSREVLSSAPYLAVHRRADPGS